MTKATAHPYMANSVHAIKEQMLKTIGRSSVEDLFTQIPEAHRFRGDLVLPPALASELDLSRHLRELLARNESCEQNLSFLGAGCWQHYVPAVCDEIVHRSEFVTPVWGTASSDYGRNQAWFEFTSQLGELLALDFVGLPVYSWGAAAGHAIRMASRITGRSRILFPRSLDPERRGVIETMCQPLGTSGRIEVVVVETDPATGRVDRSDLDRKLEGGVAALYFETPSYLGTIEADPAALVDAAHSVGALAIVGVDPLSLGVLAAPGDYRTDIAVGSIQPLGIHMNCGGGVGGFIASRDEEAFAREYPTLNLSITETVVPGELGFGMALFGQTSYGSREAGNDWTGNSTYLWAIAAATYMALLGPRGFVELGELILERSHYAAGLLAEVPGIEIMYPGGFFKEFVVRFDKARLSVADINGALRQRRIFGGKDLSAEFPELGQSSLYCVTEMHTKADIEHLASALEAVVGR